MRPQMGEGPGAGGRPDLQDQSENYTLNSQASAARVKRAERAVEYVQVSAPFVAPLCRDRREVFIKLSVSAKSGMVLMVASVAGIVPAVQRGGLAR